MSAPELQHSSKAVMVSSLHWEREWSYSQPRMPHTSKQLWYSDQHSFCRRELWAQKCLLTSTALLQSQVSWAFSTWWAYPDCRSEIQHKLMLSLLALLKGQEGHSPAVVGTSSPLSHSFQAQPVAILIEKNSEMKGRGDGGGVDETI